MQDQKQQNHNQQKKIALVNDFTGVYKFLYHEKSYNNYNFNGFRPLSGFYKFLLKSSVCHVSTSLFPSPVGVL